MSGLHGVHEEERESGNEFSIDVELEGNFSKAIETDQIEDSVDIEQVASLVRDVNRQNSFHLIESFADAIGHALLLRFPILSRVVVRVTKLTLVRMESVRSSTAEASVQRL
ncbi:dihydroneopterin aldolase [Candidatus Bipolaricaulota bacterium]